jgi:hypothetical protein
VSAIFQRYGNQRCRIHIARTLVIGPRLPLRKLGVFENRHVLCQWRTTYTITRFEHVTGATTEDSRQYISHHSMFEEAATKVPNCFFFLPGLRIHGSMIIDVDMRPKNKLKVVSARSIFIANCQPPQ